MSLLLKGCHIIDATSPDVQRDRFVLIEGDTISEVGDGHAPSAERVIDLTGAYLLPGLWDVHTHLNRGAWGCEFEEDLAKDLVTGALGHARNAMGALESGVTSLRVVGIRDRVDVALRKAFASGQFTGPRLICCGQALNTTAGHMAEAEGNTMDGPVQFLRGARTEIMHGVDQVKLVSTGGIIGTGHDVMSNITMLKEEVEAALNIARQRGIAAAVHATVPEAVKWAVSAGAHSIEHGYVLDEEAAAMMVKHDVYYVPTLALSHLTNEQASTPYEVEYSRRHSLPEVYRERANYFAPGHEDSFRMALEAGAKIASGSDQGPPGEAALLEIEFLAKWGLGPHGAIVAATRTSAEVCKVDNKVGTVETGKLADLIAVEANPLEDVHNLRRLGLVIKGGKVVVDRR